MTMRMTSAEPHPIFQHAQPGITRRTAYRSAGQQLARVKFPRSATLAATSRLFVLAARTAFKVIPGKSIQAVGVPVR
jgi:hypothetical protein